MWKAPPLSEPRSVEPDAARRGQLGAVWYVLGAIASVQVGAAFAKNLFGVVPPVTMVWLRLTSAAVMLWLLARPWRALAQARWRTLTRRDWWVAAGYAAGLLTMNWAIYESFARIPLGVAVTIEFLGPLGVALVASRRPIDLLWVGLAGLGVATLGLSPSTGPTLGYLFALVAAAGWAVYIVAGSQVGPAWDSRTLLALSCSAGAVVFAGPAVAGGGVRLAHPGVIVTGIAVGLASSVLPYLLELVALRRLPTRTFGVLMSLEPAAAALAAWLVLRERLTAADLVAMGCVITASVGAMRSLSSDR